MITTSTFSYKTRNTLILLAFLVVIFSVGGYFSLYSYPKKINKAEFELNRTIQQLDVFDGIEIEFTEIQNQIENEQKKLANLDKQIVAEATSAATYAYLNSIMKHSGLLKLDLLYKGDNTAKGYGYKAYNIKGEGSFRNIYRFTWYVERGPQIYRVIKLTLRGVESKDIETGDSRLIVPFEIELCALYADVQDLPDIKRKLSDVAVRKARNPFYPFIKKDIPPNTDELPEVERAELKAVIPGKAFIVDHNGKMHVLAEGDEVYLGYATKIDAKNNHVEFTLNKGGIIENFVLELRFDQTTKKE